YLAVSTPCLRPGDAGSCLSEGFNDDKGYGFIAVVGGPDVFVHALVQDHSVMFLDAIDSRVVADAFVGLVHRGQRALRREGGPDDGGVPASAGGGVVAVRGGGVEARSSGIDRWRVAQAREPACLGDLAGQVALHAALAAGICKPEAFVAGRADAVRIGSRRCDAPPAPGVA